MEKNDTIKDLADEFWPLIQGFIGYKDSTFIFSTRDIKNKLRLSQGRTKKILSHWVEEKKLIRVSGNKWSPHDKR